MGMPESLLRKIIREEIESAHPWEERSGDNDHVRDLLNSLYQLYKQKRDQNKKISKEIADLKKSITRGRRENDFKGKS